MKTVEQKMEFANNLDLAPLFRHAEIFTGMVLEFTKPEANESRGSVRIDFESTDIRNGCGVFGKILEYCVIAPFAGGIVEDEKTEELRYWTTMHMSYRHVDGGGNGMELFTAWYQNGEWTFRDTGQR